MTATAYHRASTFGGNDGPGYLAGTSVLGDDSAAGGRYVADGGLASGMVAGAA